MPVAVTLAGAESPLTHGVRFPKPRFSHAGEVKTESNWADSYIACSFYISWTNSSNWDLQKPPWRMQMAHKLTWQHTLLPWHVLLCYGQIPAPFLPLAWHRIRAIKSLSCLTQVLLKEATTSRNSKQQSYCWRLVFPCHLNSPISTTTTKENINRA